MEHNKQMAFEYAWRYRYFNADYCLCQLKGYKGLHYDTAYMTIYSRARSQSINTFFSQYLDAPDDVFSARAGEFIENFTEQSLMEVWVIDRNGNVVATSTGFSVENEIYPDYQAALNSNTGTRHG